MKRKYIKGIIAIVLSTAMITGCGTSKEIAKTNAETVKEIGTEETTVETTTEAVEESAEKAMTEVEAEVESVENENIDMFNRALTICQSGDTWDATATITLTKENALSPLKIHLEGSKTDYSANEEVDYYAEDLEYSDDSYISENNVKTGSKDYTLKKISEGVYGAEGITVTISEPVIVVNQDEDTDFKFTGLYIDHDECPYVSDYEIRDFIKNIDNMGKCLQVNNLHVEAVDQDDDGIMYAAACLYNENNELDLDNGMRVELDAANSYMIMPNDEIGTAVLMYQGLNPSGYPVFTAVSFAEQPIYVPYLD